MGTFLDAQISQNTSFSGGIAIPLSSTPALFGTLGLNTVVLTIDHLTPEIQYIKRSSVYQEE